MEEPNYTLLNNPWLIGIGGGILSGLIVTLLTRYFFSKRENREYYQKIVTANQEVLYAVRLGIADGDIPANYVLNAVISATAYKYGVNESDLFDKEQMSNVLIKEVMDNSFLSALSKKEYCKKISKIRTTTSPPELSTDKIEIETRIEAYKSRTNTLFSTMLGVLTAMVTVFFYFFSLRDSLSRVIYFDKLFLFVLIPVFISIGFGLLLYVFSYIKRHKREDDDTES